MKLPISLVINTKNCEKTLERSLKSANFADEIVVVDMKSTDRTVAIAKRYAKKVYFYPDVGYVEPARNFAIAKAKNQWIFVLDADEEIPPDLAEKISHLIAQKSECNCFFIPRKNIIFGKWIQKTGWWPDFQPRLFKKAAVTWKEAVHSLPEITGNTEYLPADQKLAIIHHNYASISDYLLRLDRYTSIAATGKPSVQQFSSAALIIRFNQELAKRLFLEKGFEEGIHGVALSFLQAMYQFVAYLKVWELSGRKDDVGTLTETLCQIEEMKQTLAYWIADYKIQHTTGLSAWWWRVRRRGKF
ncbi:MAG: hypothetical protein COY81_00110 [Candidatus Pacebacteria bacterium CG_4_10_14_0_8_um_filter_43_12]|nr:MAG: hypothetical protein COY81_00110 [Candidatus Pacebacteria bacterium CG_4_10_14_0_8_um_filter_43_12]